MLDRIEKVQWVISALFVVAVVGLFFYPGLSTPVSDVPAPPKSVDAQEFTKGMSAEALERHDKESKQADIGGKISGDATRPAKKEHFVVPAESIARLSDKRHVITELDLAESALDPKRRELTLKNIKEESLLRTFGFQAGDVVKGLNGKPIPFDDEGALWDLYNEQMARLHRGEPIIIIFERGGQPHQFHFTADKLPR